MMPVVYWLCILAQGTRDIWKDVCVCVFNRMTVCESECVLEGLWCVRVCVCVSVCVCVLKGLWVWHHRLTCLCSIGTDQCDRCQWPVIFAGLSVLHIDIRLWKLFKYIFNMFFYCIYHICIKQSCLNSCKETHFSANSYFVVNHLRQSHCIFVNCPCEIVFKSLSISFFFSWSLCFFKYLSFFNSLFLPHTHTHTWTHIFSFSKVSHPLKSLSPSQTQQFPKCSHLQRGSHLRNLPPCSMSSLTFYPLWSSTNI